MDRETCCCRHNSTSPRLRKLGYQFKLKSNPIISSMLVSDFQYDLPPERIAQEPLADRAGSRLLHLARRDQTRLPESWQHRSWQDRKFRDFPDLLRSDDL